MSADKYPSIFSRQMAAIVYIIITIIIIIIIMMMMMMMMMMIIVVTNKSIEMKYSRRRILVANNFEQTEVRI